MPGSERSNLLKLLKRLPALAAVVDGSAKRRAEGVFQRGLARAAIRALGNGHKLYEIAASRHLTCGRRCETRSLEHLSALLTDTIGGPRLSHRHFHRDGHTGSKLSNALLHILFHHLERRATNEGGHKFNPYPRVVDAHITHDAEVYNGQVGYLRVHDVQQGFTD